MDILSLTYVSRARRDIKVSDVEAIHRTSLVNNPMDGITGLLLFNGEAFLQIIEGAESAVDALILRLDRDPRHHAMQVTDRRSIERRFFSQWTMNFIDLGPDLAGGLKVLEREVDPLVDKPMKIRLRQVLPSLFLRLRV